MSCSPRTFRAAVAAKRRLDRTGLSNAPVARALASSLKRRFLSENGIAQLKLAGFQLAFPERFLAHYGHREYEPLTASWVRGALHPGMRAIDVGAHVGYFSLVLSGLVGESGEVFAVEPAEDNLAFLRRNLQANGRTNVTMLPVAAGARRCARVFKLTGSSDSHGFYDHPLSETVSAVTLSELPLDEVIRGPVDLAKIDVEGAELEVLAGMSRIIRESSSLRIVVEWNPACLRRAGRAPEELPAWLRAHGVRLVVVDEQAGRARPVAEILEAITQGTLASSWYGNLVGALEGAR